MKTSPMMVISFGADIPWSPFYIGQVYWLLFHFWNIRRQVLLFPLWNIAPKMFSQILSTTIKMIVVTMVGHLQSTKDCAPRKDRTACRISRIIIVLWSPSYHHHIIKFITISSLQSSSHHHHGHLVNILKSAEACAPRRETTISLLRCILKTQISSSSSSLSSL